MNTATTTKSKAKKPAVPFSAPISEVHLVPLDLIDTPEQIRKEFDQESIDHLAKDIEARGLLQPILLNPAGERFQLIAGERRLRAVKLNGATGIPALIVKTTTENALLMQLAENIQLEELSLEEECEAVCKLYESLNASIIWILSFRLVLQSLRIRFNMVIYDNIVLYNHISLSH